MSHSFRGESEENTPLQCLLHPIREVLPGRNRFLSLQRNTSRLHSQAANQPPHPQQLQLHQLYRAKDKSPNRKGKEPPRTPQGEHGDGITVSQLWLLGIGVNPAQVDYVE